jgi:hypothetical protein
VIDLRIELPGFGPDTNISIHRDGTQLVIMKGVEPPVRVAVPPGKVEVAAVDAWSGLYRRGVVDTTEHVDGAMSVKLAAPPVRMFDNVTGSRVRLCPRCQEGRRPGPVRWLLERTCRRCSGGVVPA